MYWINGIKQAKLSPNDRLVQFGDGFFTTAKLINNRFILLNYHLKRLRESARRLLFDSFNEKILKNEILKATESNIGNKVIKIIISRGSSRIGYGFNRSCKTKRIILISSMPSHYSIWRKKGIKLEQSPIRLSRNPLLAGIKHNNRLEQIFIRSYLKNKPIDEALVLDTKGFIIECCSANIFWRKGKKVFTPILRYAGVNGIMRSLTISILPKLNYKIEEVNSKMDCLQFAEEVFITNALLPIVSVCAINNKKYYDQSLRLQLSSFIKEFEFKYK